MDKLDYAKVMAAALRNRPRQLDRPAPMAASVMSQSPEQPPELNADLPLEPVNPEDWVPNPKSLASLLVGAVKPTEKLFHGSLGKLVGELRKGKGTLGEGFYLTNKEKKAAFYPKVHAIRQGIKDPEITVTPMRTSARNIFDFDETGLPTGSVSSDKLKALGYDGATWKDELIVFDPKNVSIGE